MRLKRNVFKELWLSFFGFLIFSTLITLVVFQMAASVITDEIRKNSSLTVKQIGTQMDFSITSLEYITQALANHSSIRKGCSTNMNNSHYGEIALHNAEVRGILEGQKDETLEELCVVYFGQETIITTGYSYKGGLADEIAEKLFGMSYKDLMQFLKEKKYHKVFLNEGPNGKEQMIACHPILPVNGRRFDGVVIALFDQDMYENYVNVVTDSGGTFFMHSQESEELYSSNKSNREILREHMPEREGISTVQQDGITYILARCDSEVSDFHYYILTNRTIILRDLSRMRSYVLLLLLFCLFIGIVVSYGVARYHYRPVKKLVSVINPEGSDTQQYEYHFLEKNLKELLEKEKKGEEMIVHHEKLLREHLLWRLLEGSIRDENGFRDINERYNFGVIGNNFCIVRFFLDNEEGEEKGLADISAQQEITSMIQSLLEKILEKRSLICLPENGYSLLCLICMEDEQSNVLESYGTLRIKVEQIREMLGEMLNMHVLVALSKQYESLEGVRLGYEETQDLLAYARLMELTNSLLTADYLNFAEQMNAGEQVISGDYMKKERSILNCVLAERYQEAGEKLAEAIDVYSADGYRNAHILYHIIDTIQVFLDDIQSVFPGEFYCGLNIKRRINAAKTIVEKKTVILDIFSQMEDYHQEQKKDNQSVIQQILAYLDANYTNPSLDREMIAAALNMSISSLSHTIKDGTGKTLLELIHERRISSVKDLLQDTDYTLQEIAEKVGYTNAWTLSRVFKSMVGVPPGKYRDSLH